MICEYAVEPEAVATSWERFRYILEGFGVSRGRVIADVPNVREWKSRVWKAINGPELNDIEKKRIEVLLSNAEKKFIPRHAAYDNTLPWLDNALNAHKRKALHAIIALHPNSNHPNVMAVEDVSDDQPLWKVKRSHRIRRSAEDVSKIVAPLISMSKDIIFVDRYLLERRGYAEAKVSDKHAKMLQAILRQCDCRNKRSMVYHCGWDQNAGKPEWSKAVNQIEGFIPTGLAISICVWPKDFLHNRFVITDVGGISFGHGLEQNPSSNSRFDDVFLMDDEHWGERYKEFRDAAEEVDNPIPKIAQLTVHGSLK